MYRYRNSVTDHHRVGLTLLELMVVVGIISLLVALLLPTLRAAWSSVRRMQCQSNLRQLGIALNSYHDSHGVFPPGHIQTSWPPTTDPSSLAEMSQRTTWLPHLLPELERQSLYDDYNFDLGLVGIQWAGLAANSTVHQATIRVLLCPADKLTTQLRTATEFPRSKGSYGVNWGNTNWWQVDRPGNSFRAAPFGTNSSVRLCDVIDGTTTTLLMSELIMTISGDFRGEPWNDDGGASQVFTTSTPNSTIPDQLAAPWCVSSLNPPCINVDTRREDVFSAARSKHAGGVNALYIDGSVRFVGDRIAPDSWKSQGSIHGGEAVEQF